VKECDDYLAKAESCPATRAAAGAQRTAWTEAVKNPAAKPGVATNCRAALDAFLAAGACIGLTQWLAVRETEARNSLGQIARDVNDAFAKSGRICASATVPVPADRRAVSGRKYQSSAGDWSTATPNTAVGWYCLKFELDGPQSYQYEYEATPTSFVARAHGDLNGNGVFSTFAISGRVVDGALRMDPLSETNPDE